MTRLAVFNQKGGVGKTTTALNLAAALARRRLAPLLVDLDAQAHLSQILAPAEASADSVFAFYSDVEAAARASRGRSASPARGRGELVPAHSELMKVDSLFGKGPHVLNRLKEGLDDYARGGGAARGVHRLLPDARRALALGVFAADRVLVPISADFLAVKGALALENTLRALEHVLKQRVERRYVLTRFDSRRKMAHEIAASCGSASAPELCETRIAESVGLAESPFHRKDIFAHDAKSRGARDYEQLLEELLATGFLEV